MMNHVSPNYHLKSSKPFSKSFVNQHPYVKNDEQCINMQCKKRNGCVILWVLMRLRNVQDLRLLDSLDIKRSHAPVLWQSVWTCRCVFCCVFGQATSKPHVYGIQLLGSMFFFLPVGWLDRCIADAEKSMNIMDEFYWTLGCCLS